MVTSASLNRRAKNVVIEAVVIAELEFRDVQRHILAADLVERADDAALEDAPKTFNRLGMHCANNILVLGVVNRFMREFHAEMLVANPLIGAEQANLLRDGFVNESLQSCLLHVFNDAGDDVAFAADSASDDCFAGSGRTRLSIALNPMPVICLAADECFVHLNDAAQLGFRFDQSGADFVAHGMRGFVRTETHVTLNLERANSLFAGEHQVHHLEPLAKRLVGVFKDGASDMREAIASTLDRLTLVALPFKVHGLDGENINIAATRASDPIWPTALHQIFAASLLIGEHGLKLAFGKLVYWFRSFAGHVASPVYGGQYGM